MACVLSATPTAGDGSPAPNGRSVAASETENKLADADEDEDGCAVAEREGGRRRDAGAAAARRVRGMRVIWFNVIRFALLHLAALYALYVSLAGARVATTLWAASLVYASCLSVTMGAHRLFTHKTFKANKWIRGTLILFVTVAGQNSLWNWIRDHRVHHKYSDTDADPHNSRRGFFFSHIGWLMVRKHPQVVSKGKSIDMSDMNRDAAVMFQKRFFKTLFAIFGIGVPTIVPHILWSESLWNSFFVSFAGRYVVSLNITFLVNSAAHIYGTRPFSKDIAPVENWFVSVLSLGEGWHNYHHTFPWDYRAAELGQFFNSTTTIIDYCAEKGWIYDLKYASSELVKKQSTKNGDGSHRIYGKSQRDDFDPVKN